ncbi:hypothetical protein NL529_32155, partial [Klebsiella pneumoniae]|nr:hypothetical protein [Klebsiella pneumoniae]
MSVAQFKQWVKNGDTKKALAYTPPKAVTERAKPKGPYSLFQFLASKGGIRDQGGELASLGLTTAFVPAFGRLVR